jgi:hypothetical protein
MQEIKIWRKKSRTKRFGNSLGLRPRNKIFQQNILFTLKNNKGVHLVIILHVKQSITVAPAAAAAATTATTKCVTRRKKTLSGMTQAPWWFVVLRKAAKLKQSRSQETLLDGFSLKGSNSLLRQCKATLSYMYYYYCCCCYYILIYPAAACPLLLLLLLHTDISCSCLSITAVAAITY